MNKKGRGYKGFYSIHFICSSSILFQPSIFPLSMTIVLDISFINLYAVSETLSFYFGDLFSMIFPVILRYCYLGNPVVSYNHFNAFDPKRIYECISYNHMIYLEDRKTISYLVFKCLYPGRDFRSRWSKLLSRPVKTNL